MLYTESMNREANRKSKGLARAAVGLWVATVLLVSGGGIVLYQGVAFRQGAMVTEGEIVELRKSRSGTSGTHSSKRYLVYTPVYQYTDHKGAMHKMEASYSSTEPVGKVGDKIQVLYSRDNPADAKMDTFFANWGIALILLALGTIAFVINNTVIKSLRGKS